MNERIVHIVKKFYENKLFTHVYIEYGFLKLPNSAYIYELYEDTSRYIFDLASITKAIVTTSLCMKLHLEHVIDLSSKLGNYLSHSTLDNIILSLTFMDLLTHTSGLPSWRNFYICRSDTDEFIEKWDEAWFIKRLNSCVNYIQNNKGKRIYSDVGFMLLGYVIEKIISSSLSELFYRFCVNDLNMNLSKKELGYAPDIDKNKCISTGFCKLRNRELIGEANDENCVALGGIMGHAGLFSSGKALKYFLNNFIDTSICVELQKYWGNDICLGWQHGNDKITQHLFGAKAYGHYGFTGTSFWINFIDQRLPYCIILTNRTINRRDNPLIKDFRLEIFQQINLLI